MAGNIIPAIATTNAMTAGLCVLQAFKVLRDELDKAKMVFLTRSTERTLMSEALMPPNPDCPVCSVAQATLVVDTERATLNDLVEDLLRMQLGYGEEFSISTESGMALYDPDEDQLLPKTFNELGLKNDSFITVVDEAEENPKVNVVFSISEKPLEKDMKPIHLAEKLKIATKPKESPSAEISGNGHNHPTSHEQTNGKRKRDADEGELEAEVAKKRGKTVPKPDDDIVVLDDVDDGAIVIDDD
jgi:ubiquitin-like 1-activating enzyme E1 B